MKKLKEAWDLILETYLMDDPATFVLHLLFVTTHSGIGKHSTLRTTMRWFPHEIHHTYKSTEVKAKDNSNARKPINISCIQQILSRGKNAGHQNAGRTSHT